MRAQRLRLNEQPRRWLSEMVYVIRLPIQMSLLFSVHASEDRDILKEFCLGPYMDPRLYNHDPAGDSTVHPQCLLTIREPHLEHFGRTLAPAPPTW
jgi:hypothetical protein